MHGGVGKFAVLVLLFGLSGCGPAPPGGPPGTGAPGFAVRYEPGGDEGEATRVGRLRVVGRAIDPATLALFRGTLSAYYLGRIRSGELPATLASRQLPTLAWAEAPGVVVAPSLALDAADTYSLAASNSGLVAEFQVNAASVEPFLRRVFPPAGMGGSHAVYCAAAGTQIAFTASELLLDPGTVRVSAHAGVDPSGALSNHCLSFDIPAQRESGVLVPAPLIQGFALDPQPLRPPPSATDKPLTCHSDEIALGPGCARAEDDRAFVRTPNDARLWVIETPNAPHIELTRNGARFLLRGLTPDAEVRVRGSVYACAGEPSVFDISFHTEPPRTRVVISEVLANPLGLEPQAEWIELVNDAAAAIDVSGFRLEDARGSSTLPPGLLAPGEYALLVRNDFAPGRDDVPPNSSAQRLAMPTLGGDGLTNAGEALALYAADGALVSQFPALNAAAGQSIARAHPWSLDDDPQAFTPGTPTPGSPNP